MSDVTAKSSPSLKAYRSEKKGASIKATAFLLLDEWETGLKQTNQSAEGVTNPKWVFEKMSSELPVFRQMVVEEVLAQETAYGKQQVVAITHCKLLHVAELISSTRSIAQTAWAPIGDFQKIEHLIMEAFLFMEEYFSLYLDADRPAPPFLVRKIADKISEAREVVAPFIHAVPKSFGIVQEFLAQLFSEKQEYTVRQLGYAQQLASELKSESEVVNEARFRDRLYFLNFNEEAFVMAEFERLSAISAGATGKTETLTALRFEQKRINQLPALHQEGWTLAMPALREQINGWITEEIRFIESGSFSPAASKDSLENTEKIHTSLSVAKLAVIIRLLVIDKIIINRNISPMLKVAAKIFTTLQRDEISSGSLETKYHAPDKATIQMVRDMLFKWINILGKLQ